jgi:hypothetical protein
MGSPEREALSFYGGIMPEEELTEATILHPVKCQFCDKRAQYDAKTAFGSWAYLCDDHFELYAPFGLGTGKGQRLIVKGD